MPAEITPLPAPPLSGPDGHRQNGSVPRPAQDHEATDLGAELDACVATFRRYLYFPDPGPLYVVLATVVANEAEGDPVWLLAVGPPGVGKTETLGALSGLPRVHPAATITEAALLSGTPKREMATDAKGGLLRAIGDAGIIVAKDFGSVLSMHRDARSAVLAALREIYDGSWTRHVGTDGGRCLSWSGKVGFIGGCTPAIDSHHAVMGAMGERFLLFRWPVVDEDAQARRALEHIGSERAMRRDLAAAVAKVLNGADRRLPTAAPNDGLRDWLVRISTLAVRCRSAVERDSYSREIELIPETEAPARLALVLLRLFNGLCAIGTDEALARRLVAKAALDSMPQVRRRVLDCLMANETPLTTTAIAEAVGYPTSTIRRACEDLTGHGVLTRSPGGAGKADSWAVTKWARRRWPTVPEMSGGCQMARLGVPEMSGGEGKAQLNGSTGLSFNTSLTTEEDKTGKVALRTADEYDYDLNDEAPDDETLARWAAEAESVRRSG